METLKLSKKIYTEIIDHAKSLAPVESCGYLAGKDGEITCFFQMTNTDNSPEHFAFDPKEQFQVVKEARSQDLDLLAVYHSHPASPARLSQEDIRLFNDSKMVYIIVSLLNEEEVVKGFTLNKPDDRIVEIEQVELKIN